MAFVIALILGALAGFVTFGATASAGLAVLIGIIVFLVFWFGIVIVLTGDIDFDF